MLPFVVASILHLRVLAALEVVVFQSELGRAFYGRVTPELGSPVLQYQRQLVTHTSTVSF